MTEQRIAIDQYLTFELAGETYAISVGQVQEVLEYDRVTAIPRSADYMRGVVNIRGRVVPVIDLRRKFGMEAVEPTRDTSIIVLDLRVGEQEMIVGALADSVQAVVRIDDDEIEPPPTLGNSVDRQFVRGMANRDGRFIILLDVELILSSDDLSAVTGSLGDGAVVGDEAAQALFR